MGIVTWLREFITGKPSAERIAADKLDAEIAAIRRMSSKPAAHIVNPPPLRGLSTSSLPSGKARIRPGTSGGAASFTYTSHHGEVTERTILNWHSEARYVHGHCILRGAELTFRKDRIENWTAS